MCRKKEKGPHNQKDKPHMNSGKGTDPSPYSAANASSLPGQQLQSKYLSAARPLDHFTKEQWSKLTHISTWKGLALVAHAWAVIFFSIFGTIWAWSIYPLWGLLAAPFAIFLLGGRQLGLAILMHESAHGLLHNRRSVNNFVGQWLCGAATGADLNGYRIYHLQHHRHTQTSRDPDLSLSSIFPVDKKSIRRKIWRDISGQTFFRQRAYQFTAGWAGLKFMLKPLQNVKNDEQAANKHDIKAGTLFNRQSRSGVDSPLHNKKDTRAVTLSIARFLIVQTAIILFIFLISRFSSTLSGNGIWFGITLWFIALATSFQLFLRIRNIAEHACVPSNIDNPFTYARTTYAGPLARMSIAPYWVNFHAEHHLFMGIACYRLRQAHQWLKSGDSIQTMTIAPNYRSVMREVTRKVTHGQHK